MLSALGWPVELREVVRCGAKNMGSWNPKDPGSIPDLDPTELQKPLLNWDL